MDSVEMGYILVGIVFIIFFLIAIFLIGVETQISQRIKIFGFDGHLEEYGAMKGNNIREYGEPLFETDLWEQCPNGGIIKKKFMTDLWMVYCYEE